MKEVERIEDQLRRAFAGDAWYGPPLREVLADITPEKAVARPLENAHSIWEIVLHIAAWEGAARARLEEGWVDLPKEGDWPLVTDTSEAGWKNTLAKLEHVHAELLKAIARLTDARLEERLGAQRDISTGAGVSVYVTLHGIVQHNVYHAGQIALLKKA